MNERGKLRIRRNIGLRSKRSMIELIAVFLSKFEMKRLE
jgi:hypothetical protein